MAANDAPNAIATVTAVKGGAYARDSRGNLRKLSPGDVVKEGEVVIAATGGHIDFAFSNGDALTLYQGIHKIGAAAISGDTLDTGPALGATDVGSNAASANIDKIILAIQQGKPIDDLLEETAAGLTGGAESDGHGFVRLSRITEGVSSASYSFDAHAAHATTAEAVLRDFPASPVIVDIITATIVGSDKVVEGTTLSFDVKLDQTATSPTVVTFRLDPSGPHPVTLGVDTTKVYVNGVEVVPDAGGNYSYTVPAGQNGFTVTVDSVDDAEVEYSETFILSAATATQAVPAAATGTLLDNDKPIVDIITATIVGSDTVVEGKTLSFDVKLDQTATSPTVVTFRLDPSDPHPVTLGVDTTKVYVNGVEVVPDAGGNYSYTVPAGQNGFTVTVDSVDDAEVEYSETLILSAATATQAVPAAATGTLLDNDKPIVDIITATIVGSDTVVEGKTLSFDVKLDQTATSPTVVTFRLDPSDPHPVTLGVDTTKVYVNGVEVVPDAGGNYSYTVPAGQNGFTVTVDSVDDAEVEYSETLILSAATATQAVPAAATGTLLDNDHAPVITDDGLGRVSEEGLPGGIKDGLPSGSDTTNLAAVSGTLGISDPDGDAIASVTVGYGGPDVYSGGIKVVWTGTGTATDPLIGKANGVEVARLTMGADGKYTFTLSRSIDHPASGEDVKDLEFTVTASDGTNSGQGTLTIHVEDDMPSTNGDIHTVVVPSGDPNVAPVASASSSHNLLGLIGVSALNLIDLSTHQAFGAFDANNNIAKVVIEYRALLTVGSHKLTASQALAEELGLKIEFYDDFGLISLMPTSRITITSLDGGPIDNLALNELLKTVYFQDSPIGVEVLDATTITVTDTQGLSSSASVGTLANANVLSASTPPADVHEGGAGSDSLAGTGADEQFYGYAGDDTLSGGAGDDILRGGAGNDVLDGGAGNDILIGGAGDDTLSGGAGSDIFRWEAGHQGAQGAPAIDTVVDFDPAALLAGGDILDLRGLLQGENHAILSHYLHFEKVGNDTVVHISRAGGFAGGYDPAKEDQTIVLKDVDLVTGRSSDQQIILALTNDGKLLTDTSPSTTMGTLPGDFGADGGYIRSIGIGGHTYTYDPAANSVTQTGTSGSVTGYSYDAGSHWLTVTTARGETIMVNMQTGDYVYTASSPLAAGEHTDLTYTLADHDGDTASATVQFTGGQAEPNVAPDAILVSGHNLLGLVGVTALDLIDLRTRQAFGAFDRNNNITKVEITYQALLGLGVYTLAASQALAAELGLRLVIEHDDGLLNLLLPSSRIVITALDGGMIDNLDINEFLATVRFEQSAIQADVLNATTITVTDAYGLTDTAAVGTLAEVNLLSSSYAVPGLMEGTGAADTLTGIGGGARLYGYGGDDTLIGGDGNDLLRGGVGNDALNGGNGNDILIGGGGNDSLVGGLGVDVFRWELADKGTPGAPAVDIVTGFDTAGASTGGDMLDLRDLLEGEQHASGIGNLENYIDIATDAGGNTVIRISSGGSFVNGNYAAGAEDQRIELKDVDLYAQYAIGSGNEADLIKAMLQQGSLVVD